MDRMMVSLDQSELDSLISINEDGSVDMAGDILARLLSLSLGLAGVRVAVSNVDYLQRVDGTPEPATRTASGVWWHPVRSDSAVIGGFIIEGTSLSITNEGESDAPLVENADTLARATGVIASQYDDSEVLETGLLKVVVSEGTKLVRVVVTRDHRVHRPRDILTEDELGGFVARELGLVVVQLIGGEKALVIKHGI